VIPTRTTGRTRTGHPALFLLVGLALLVAACGTTATRTPAPSAGSATPGPSGAPGSTDGPTGGPTEQPTGEATEPPTGTPTDAPTGTSAPSAGGADACSGNDENRAFYEAVAGDVTWDVYCAVLPAGWFVDAGSFRLAGGGKLEISYKGPGGQRIEMRQGTYCAGVEGCIPTGPDAGSASYGDRPARLVDTGGGTWLVVAEGGDVDWEAKGIGMDGPTLAGHTAAFAKVGE
jgi:hypothetical protein